MPILCATDFSPSSRSAAELSVALARKLHRKLILVNATEPPPIALPEATVGIEAWEAAIQEASRTQLLRLAESLRHDGIDAEALAEVGSPATVVLDVIAQRKPSLVVIGTHGRKGATRFFLGSVAEKVVRESSTPVLVVPQVPETVADTGHAWTEETWRLLVASDGTPASHTALAWALGLERALHVARADVTVLRLYWPQHEAHHYGLDLAWHEGDPPAQLSPLLERDLQHEIAVLGEGRTPPSVVLRAASRDPVHDVMAEAVARKVHALVVGIPQGRTPAHVALRPGPLLRAATVPVLCIPLQAAPPDEALPPIRTALVATDLSDDSHEAIRTAYRLMRGPGQRVELCHVVLRGPAGDGIDLPFAPPLSPEEHAMVEARLKALVPKAATASGIVTHVSALEGDGTAETLLQAAARLDADLIVLAFRGRTGAGRLIFGSVAEEVARRSPLPVLLVHPR